MTTVAINNSPYLRNQRNFPQEMQALTVEMDKAYIDIAQKVNDRTIGIYTSAPIVTGNSWYLKGNGAKQQTLRQVYQFSGAGSINHNINVANIIGFVQVYGTFTDGTNWYPLPYVDVTAANNQVNIYVSPTQIVITAGGGTPPSITSGFAIVEWLANV